MPAASSVLRPAGAAALRYEPSWPSWARIAGDYRFAPQAGRASAEFADGAVRQAPAAASTLLRRRVRVEVPGERIADWRRFLATAPSVPLRWRDPEDGIERRAVVEAPDGAPEARQVSDRAGRTRWETELVLSGWSDEVTGED